MAPPTDLATMLPPLVEPVWAKWLVVAASYLITLIFASDIVLTVQRRLHTGVELALKSDDDDAPRADGQHAGVPPPAAITPQTLDTGWVIGRCENIITVTFVLMGQVTALAIVFTAKSIVRKDEIHANPGYYLGGTLVNFVWGLLVGSIGRALAFGF